MKQHGIQQTDSIRDPRSSSIWGEIAARRQARHEQVRQMTRSTIFEACHASIQGNPVDADPGFGEDWNNGQDGIADIDKKLKESPDRHRVAAIYVSADARV